mgnify:CR=1 FL=1
MDDNALLEEWKLTIKVQMHFNELILKFRTGSISVLTVMFAAAITSFKLVGQDLTVDLSRVVYMLLAFWIALFVLDYFYYNKLLLGAVKHADKFEGALFDAGANKSLTTSIKEEVSTRWSKFYIIIFYLLPAIPLMWFLCELQ